MNGGREIERESERCRGREKESVCMCGVKMDRHVRCAQFNHRVQLVEAELNDIFHSMRRALLFDILRFSVFLLFILFSSNFSSSLSSHSSIRFVSVSCEGIGEKKN